MLLLDRCCCCGGGGAGGLVRKDHVPVIIGTQPWDTVAGRADTSRQRLPAGLWSLGPWGMDLMTWRVRALGWPC